MTLTRKFPPTRGVRWFNVVVLTLTPLIAGYGIIGVVLSRETVLFSVAYYVFSMLGESKHNLCGRN